MPSLESSDDEEPPINAPEEPGTGSGGRRTRLIRTLTQAPENLGNATPPDTTSTKPSHKKEKEE